MAKKSTPKTATAVEEVTVDAVVKELDESITAVGTAMSDKEETVATVVEDTNTVEVPEIKGSEAVAASGSTVIAKTIAGDDDTIIVALNFPSPVTFDITASNGETVKVRINGNAENLRGTQKGVLPDVGTYGKTSIKKWQWEAIKEKYRRHPLIKNGLLVSASEALSIDAMLADMSTIRNGREPFAADGKDSRAPGAPVIQQYNGE